MTKTLADNTDLAVLSKTSVDGVGEIELTLRRAGKGFVLGVNSNHHFNSWRRTPAVGGTAEQIAAALDASRWQRLLVSVVSSTHCGARLKRDACAG